MTLVLGTYNGISGGNISMVWAPNTSTISYFELSKTALFDVDIIYNHGFSATGSLNSRYSVVFYNITDSVELARCFVVMNNSISTSDTAIINGLF